jgi:hypothetical protein
VNISEFLRLVASGYDRQQGLGTETQQLLRGAEKHLLELVPGGIHIEGSGGKGVATLTPWVGFFDPDETVSPEEGLYLVYLFAADLRTVNLMLLQGITTLSEELGSNAAARAQLATQAKEIRGKLAPSALAGLTTSVELASGGFRQKGYSASCVAATTYSLPELAQESVLRSDLARFFVLYQDAVAANRTLAVTSAPTTTMALSEYQRASLSSPLVYFRPKSDADYVAHITAREMVKTRRHETLVAEYGHWSRTMGFQPSTAEHPRDLVLRREHREWLIEAKIVYRGNATEAVRAAIGQLLTYRHLLYRSRTAPRLVALFSEPVGELYVQLLEELGILTVWKEAATWRSSTSASADRLGQ